MIAVAPPIPVATLPTAGSAVVSVVDSPDWMAALPAGTQIRAEVVARDAQTVVLRTAQGQQLTIPTPPLPSRVGSELTVHVVSSGARPQVTVSLPDRPAPPAPAVQTPAPVALPPATVGSTVVATVVKVGEPPPAPVATPPGSVAPPLPNAQPAVAPQAGTGQAPPTTQLPPQSPSRAAPGAPTFVAPAAAQNPSGPASPAPRPTQAGPLQPLPAAPGAGFTALPSPGPTQVGSTPVATGARATAPPVPTPTGIAAPPTPAAAGIAQPAAPQPPTGANAVAPSQPQPAGAVHPPIANAPGQATSPEATPTAVPAAPATTAPAAPPGTASLGLTAGEKLALRLLGMAPPTAALPPLGQAAQPAPGQVTLSATVIGTTTSGQPILDAGGTLMTLEAGPVAPGSTLLLAASASRAAAPSTARPPPSLPLQPPLPELDSLPELAAAANTVGGPAQQAMQAVLPKPGRTLAAEMMFLLSALRVGDPKAWLGEAPRSSLERAGKGRALSALHDEFREAARKADAPSGEWRQQMIPLLNGTIVEPIRMQMWRAEEDGGEDGKRGGGTRFLIDLDLSNLGQVQIDGFSRKQSLDLVIRTSKPLDADVRGDMERLYADAASARGLNGMLGFQVAPPVRPIPEPPKGRTGLLV